MTILVVLLLALHASLICAQNTNDLNEPVANNKPSWRHGLEVVVPLHDASPVGLRYRYFSSNNLVARFGGALSHRSRHIKVIGDTSGQSGTIDAERVWLELNAGFERHFCSRKFSSKVRLAPYWGVMMIGGVDALVTEFENTDGRSHRPAARFRVVDAWPTDDIAGAQAARRSRYYSGILLLVGAELHLHPRFYIGFEMGNGPRFTLEPPVRLEAASQTNELQAQSLTYHLFYFDAS